MYYIMGISLRTYTIYIMACREYRGDTTTMDTIPWRRPPLHPEDTILWIPVLGIHTMGYRGYTILWIPVLVHTMGWSTRSTTTTTSTTSNTYYGIPGDIPYYGYQYHQYYYQYYQYYH